MGSVALIGIEGVKGPLPAAVLARLREAHVVVSAPGDTAGRALGEAGVTVHPLEHVGPSAGIAGERVAERLVGLSHDGDVAFVSVGSPKIGDGLLTGLLDRVPAGVDLCSSLSPVQIVSIAFDIGLTDALHVVDASALSSSGVGGPDSRTLVSGVDDGASARHLSEQLACSRSSTHPVVVFARLHDGGYRLQLVTVAGLAHVDLTAGSAVYVPPVRIEPRGEFEEFVRTIAVLRGPDGCPWDREQDHMSLRRNMIEEAYEAVAAIESGDAGHLAEELGDVLLQIVLHAQIAADDGRFTIEDVVAGITDKIRRRHPHVFGDAVAGTASEVIEKWDAIKRDEKAGEGTLHGIPEGLPALMWAQKISRRAVGVGFEWDSLEAVWDKVHEEIDELKGTEPGSPEAADEIGDLLFTVVNLARKQGIDSEEALRATCRKFIARFEDMERSAAGAGTSIADIDITEMERLWRQAKGREGSDT